MRAAPSGELAPPRAADSIRAMANITPLESFAVPLGGQAVELQEIVHADGGMALLRIRIREGKRFTVFDVDAQTAQRWGEAMSAWGRRQRK